MVMCPADTGCMYFTFSIHNKVHTKHTIVSRSKMTFNFICKNPRGNFVRADIRTRDQFKMRVDIDIG